MSTPRELTHEKEVCPVCRSQTLDPRTLRCLCGCEFTATGLADLRRRQGLISDRNS